MKTEKRLLGDLGEDAAVTFLKKQHYRIKERNFSDDQGNEIDIVAENRDHLVIVEVKTRTYNESNIARFGTPSAAVDARKRRCLLVATRAYLSLHPCKKRIRFDVAEVYLSKETPQTVVDVHYMMDAFRP